MMPFQTFAHAKLISLLAKAILIPKALFFCSMFVPVLFAVLFVSARVCKANPEVDVDHLLQLWHFTSLTHCSQEVLTVANP